MDIKTTSILLILLLMLIAQTGRAWEVDFSRRQKPAVQKQDLTDDDAPPSNQPGPSFVKSVHNKEVGDRQELVILNTQKGFVPSNVRIHKGLHYKINVVNVNEDKKNVSFIMDEFNQHYATYYGQIRTFNLDPDKEGVYTFECPETTASGKLVVYGNGKNSAPAQPDIQRNVSSEP